MTPENDAEIAALKARVLALAEYLKFDESDINSAFIQVDGRQFLVIQAALRSYAASLGAEPAAWQWRSRIKGGAWDAWENGRYGQIPPPFMEIEERILAAPPAPAPVVDPEVHRRVVEALRNVRAIAAGCDRLDGFPRSEDEKQRRLVAIEVGVAEVIALAGEDR